ncbi:hypothetical protein B0H11DRAFT_1743605 [Mycena galericulata]|nr:hypothetical protein B0H11DRAFT_1743605 [Mycena galericulata]
MITFLVLYDNNFLPSPLANFNLASSPGQRRAVLPIPSRTYVISLPGRKDRQQQMERLRNLLALQWSYVMAEDSKSAQVSAIMSQVRSIRQEMLKRNGYEPNTTARLPFEWPEPGTSVPAVPFEEIPPLLDSRLVSFDSAPLICATENFTLTPYSPGLPKYRTLSRSRIACWHSHLSVIRRAADHVGPKASLILEDDVDMEEDVKERLLSVWGSLPPDWDIVFLGHCWSNESYYPALPKSQSESNLHPPRLLESHLHPSHAPLCTHAYALSPSGARTLLRHLTHPPFAYSRAIDHALAWLVKSGRLRSFSVVPSVVVQRKDGMSDVMPGKGSKWREKLVHGVLADEAGIFV